MKAKIFTLNDNGKIEFTEKELKALLDEIYNDGYFDATHRGYIYYTPWKYPYTPYYTTSTTAGNGITINDGTSTAGTIKYETPITTASCSSSCKGCDK